MDLKQLRTFRAVAELGSLSKAADRLRAAQPALSRHIKLLEHELRVELFVRNGRGMLLTSAGRMLLDRTTGPDPPDRAGSRRPSIGERQSVRRASSSAWCRP